MPDSQCSRDAPEQASLEDGGWVTTETGLFSPDSLYSALETFGYDYRDLSFTSTVGDRGTPAFEGWLGLQSLPSGISTVASDLTSLHDCVHQGTAERSINIMFLLEGNPDPFSVGMNKQVSVAPTAASIVGLADSTEIRALYGERQRYRTLLMRARPEDMADKAIAEQIAGFLRTTTVTPMPISRRIAPLIEELAAPSADGAVGRMLMDGCALALLAHALLTLGQAPPPPASAPTLAHRDYAKVLQVRDRMLANLEEDFTLDALARDAGMSITVLKDKFSAVFGQSVFNYLREARLHHAKVGLETKGWTVSQAAYFVGYRHHSNFTTAFRRKFGAPPRSFLKR